MLTWSLVSFVKQKSLILCIFFLFFLSSSVCFGGFKNSFLLIGHKDVFYVISSFNFMALSCKYKRRLHLDVECVIIQFFLFPHHQLSEPSIVQGLWGLLYQMLCFCLFTCLSLSSLSCPMGLFSCSCNSAMYYFILFYHTFIIGLNIWWMNSLSSIFCF